MYSFRGSLEAQAVPLGPRLQRLPPHTLAQYIQGIALSLEASSRIAPKSRCGLAFLARYSDIALPLLKQSTLARDLLA
eukprot:4893353-Pyramimonas_sp.AAC.1